MKKTIVLFLFYLFLASIVYEAFSNTNGASSQTGAPGEASCSQSGCHGAGNGDNSSGGLSDNTGGGSVSILGISGNYVPGKKYTITIRAKQAGAKKFGFNAEVLDAGNGNTGTLSITQTGTYLRTGVNATRNTVSHGHSGATGSIAGTANDSCDFYFDWTAPASSIGPVTIYASAIAANVDGLPDAGDLVYTSSLTLNPSTSPSPVILLSRSSFANPAFYGLASSTGNTQFFYAAGQGLTGDLTVSVSGSQFQLSKTSSGSWTNSITLTNSSGVVAATQIFVRFTAPASGSSSGTITISGGGASNKTISLTGTIRTPAINSPSVSSLDFGTVNIGSGNSSPKSFTVAFSSPVEALLLTAPSGFELSTTFGYDYSSTLSPVFSGTGFNLTVYVRLKNPQSAGSLNANLTISMAGATTQNVNLKANLVTPSKWLMASVSGLSLFTGSPNTASTEQYFLLNGSGLTSNVVVTSTPKFEISLSSGSGFDTTLSITPSGGNLSAVKVYVRYLSASASLDYTDILATSTGTDDQYIRVYGDCFGAPIPGIIATGTFSAFSAVVGTPSASQSFVVSGKNLSADLVVTPPSEFEVSLSSGSGFGNKVSLTPSSGKVGSTTVYLRYNPSAAGNHNGNVSVSSSGATTQTLTVSGSATDPPPVFGNSANLNTFSVYVGNVSSEQVFKVWGVHLTSGLKVKAPTPFQVSLTSGSSYADSLVITPNSGKIDTTAVYVRYYPQTVGTHNGNISLNTSGTNPQNIAVKGVSSGIPKIVYTASLNNFTATTGTSSASQSFKVAAEYLTANLMVSAPAQFEVSLSSGSGFSNTLSLTPNSGKVDTTPVYVRFSPFAPGSQSGDITLSSSGATTEYVAVSGTASGKPTPAILALGSLANFATPAGTPSVVQSFKAWGGNLIGDLILRAPANFQISLSAGSGFSDSLILFPVSETVDTQLIYVRYDPVVAGNHSGNITLSSPGANPQNVPAQGSSVASIAANATLNSFTTLLGTASAAQMFSVSGVNLTGKLSVIAPALFEVSLSSTSGYGSSVSLDPVLGTVNSTPVYCRYLPLVAGSHNGELTVTSAGVNPLKIAVSGTAKDVWVKPMEEAPALSVFPNPNKGSFRVVYLSAHANDVLVLVNSAGQTVYSASFRETEKEMDFGYLAPGIYGLRLLSAEGVIRAAKKISIMGN